MRRGFPVRIGPRRPSPIENRVENDPGAPARQGAAEAEAADLRLRLQESHGRERLLRERALRAEERLEDALRNEHDLRGQIDRFSEFHRAVVRSAPWRVIQFLRGLVGRKW
jgi:hypothetical protein